MESSPEEQEVIQLCTFISPPDNDNGNKIKSQPPPPSLPSIVRRTFKCCESCALKEEQLFQAMRLERENNNNNGNQSSNSLPLMLRKFIQKQIDSLFHVTLLETSKKPVTRTRRTPSMNGRLPCRAYILSFMILPIISIIIPLFNSNMRGSPVYTLHLVDGSSISPAANSETKSDYSSWVNEMILFSTLGSITLALVLATAHNAKTTKQEEMNTNLLQSDCLKNYDTLDNGEENTNEIARQSQYARILSDAIKCKTISFDKDDHENKEEIESFHRELIKLHKLLEVSFPILYERYPPIIINDYSLLFKIPGSQHGTALDNDGLEVGRGQKPIMLCSHLDVVPAPNGEEGEANHWKRDPFGGDIVDGVIWGRGAIDNKHNVIGQLGAVEEMIASNKLPNRTMYIAIGHDEEIGGPDGAKSIAKYLKEELGDKVFEFILDEGTMIISGAIPGAKDNVALIGTAEKGHMSVELSITGGGGHSSMPPLDSQNSLMNIMSKAIMALEANPAPAHFEKGSVFRNTLSYLAPKLSFPMSLICSNFWLFGPLMKGIIVRASNGAAASIRTTTAITKINGGSKLNMLPNEVKVYVNHRLHPSDTFADVLEHDRRTINDDRIKIRVMDEYLTEASPVSGHETTGFSLLEKAVTQTFGNASAPALVIGNTDTRWYWDLSDQIFRFSPIQLTMAETAMFHGIDERIRIKSLVSIVDFYKNVICMTDKM